MLTSNEAMEWKWKNAVLVAMFQIFVEMFYNHVKILGDYIKSKKEIYVNDKAQNRSLFCKKKKKKSAFEKKMGKNIILRF